MNGNLTKHERTHDPNRELFVKQEEQRLDFLLFTKMKMKVWTIKDRPPPVGYVYKEYQLSYDKTTPLSDRAHFRLDYVIGVPGGVIVLECDEYYHRGERTYDDAVRMLDVEAELDARAWLSGPKLWIRYNPDAFRIGTTNNKPPRFRRERWLRDVITRLHLDDSFQNMILYAFYPTPNAIAVLPKVAFKPKYPPELVDRARSHVDPMVPPTCLMPWLVPLAGPALDEDDEPLEDEDVAEEDEYDNDDDDDDE